MPMQILTFVDTDTLVTNISHFNPAGPWDWVIILSDNLNTKANLGRKKMHLPTLTFFMYIWLYAYILLTWTSKQTEIEPVVIVTFLSSETFFHTKKHIAPTFEISYLIYSLSIADIYNFIYLLFIFFYKFLQIKTKKIKKLSFTQCGEEVMTQIIYFISI